MFSCLLISACEFEIVVKCCRVVFSGPLWQWSGRNFQNKRKGKGKKIFYKAIVRGDETISVSKSVIFPFCVRCVLLYSAQTMQNF